MHHDCLRKVFAVLGCVVLSGCGAAAARESRQRAERGTGIAFEHMPTRALSTCRSSVFVRTACPTVVPAFASGGRLVTFARLVWGGKIFEFGTGGEVPGHPELDHPPQFVHLVIAGGDLARLFPFRLPPSRPAVRIRNGLRSKPRARAVSFGRFTWGCRSGNLVLAPSPAMNGGIVGDHLVYWWRSRNRTYAVTLHSWEPFLESVAVFRRIVRSVPTSRCPRP
jgi:hypothetical protein